MDPTDVAHFRESGFVVLRSRFDPGPLSAEIDQAFRDGFAPSDTFHVVAVGDGTVSFRYLPMMCERTPVSLRLLERFLPLAAELVEQGVLPVRAKGTTYFGDTAWHRDSEHDLASVAFAAYLDPLDASSGALRVLPGSHHDRAMTIPPGLGGDATDRGEALETDPGDVIVFDEHLVHASRGGEERRQWRVDFVADPGNPDGEAQLQAYFAQIFPEEQRSPGYNANLYPSYGLHWQAQSRPWTTRLRHLGVYQWAEAKEGG